MGYKCTSPFKSSNGTDYRYGDRISEQTYSNLHYYERPYFDEESDDEDDDGLGIVDTLLTGLSLLSNLSSDDSSSDSSSSDDSFGGGDFGGGGASGDF